MYELPTEIMIEGIPYPIRNRGDYRMVLDAFSVLEDEELEQKERIISALMIFYDDLNDFETAISDPHIESRIKQMYWFFRGGKEEDISNTKNQKLIDWDGDSAIIVSAINNVAGREVRSQEYTHWWTFLAYYMAIGESTLSTVVGIRNKIVSGKTLEKWEREYRQHNPQYFHWRHKSIDEIDAENWLASVWNKDKE